MKIIDGSECLDFNPVLKDKVFFLDMQDIWSVSHNDVFSINNMSDRELRESVVEDVLAVTMWSKTFAEPMDFKIETLMRFLVTDNQKERVLTALNNDEIKGLFITDEQQQLRIRDHRDILQAAMDYCGNWYHGYVIPPNIDVLMSNPEMFGEALEQYGSFDNVVETMTMEFKANQHSKKTIN